MAPYLLCMTPRAALVSHALTEPLTTIGSSPDASIRIVDPDVASVHARIEHRDGQYVLVREAQPMLVNGMRVRIHVLSGFDLIVIGKTALSFRTDGAPETAAAPTDPRAPGSAIDILHRMHGFVRRSGDLASVSELAEQLVADVVALTGAARGTLVGFTSEDDPFSVATSAHGTFSGEEAAFSTTLLRKMRDAHAPVFVENVLDDPELRDAPSIAEGTTSAIATPVACDGRVLGALYVSGPASSGLSPAAIDLVRLYAEGAVSILQAQRKARTLAERLRNLGEDDADDGVLVGESEPIRALRRTVRKVAPSAAPVLVVGETGTGKELVAREIHRLSGRAHGPFVAVNCGAIPADLLASELFGHVRGAFTTAQRDRDGKLRSAEGGTLFLDEIGEMPPAQQVALLRVLQEERVTPVGSDASIPIDVRIVCATNRDLDEDIRSERFRKDLYFRLAVVRLEVPPLRDRQGDVFVLAEHLLRAHAHDADVRLADDALIAIGSARWEGNVRELDAAIRRALLLRDGPVITASDLGLEPPSSSRGPVVRPLSVVRDELLRRYVRDVVARFDGNRTAAAAALMVTPRTVFKYMEE